MALIQKTNPVGLDKEIQDFQTYLYSKLGFTDWNSYPRIYSISEWENDKKKGFIPAHFDNGINYDEVFANDNFTVTSFFVAADEETVDRELRNEAKVALIFQVKLDQLFPSIDHRSDEEFNRLVRKVSDAYVGSEEFKRSQKISNNVSKVYKEFVTDEMKAVETHPNYVVRFEYDVIYDDFGCQ